MKTRLPVGPAAGMVDLARQIVLLTAGSQQVLLHRRGGRVGRDRSPARAGLPGDRLRLHRVARGERKSAAERRSAVRGLLDERLMARAVFVIRMCGTGEASDGWNGKRQGQSRGACQGGETEIVRHGRSPFQIRTRGEYPAPSTRQDVRLQRHFIIDRTVKRPFTKTAQSGCTGVLTR